MQLHISPSLRHVTVLPGKGVREFIKVKVGSRRISYRMVFYSLLFLTFVLRFIFVLTKQLHCLSLSLANEHAMNANARLQLPSPELVPALVDNSFFHFVLASDNILAASVVANSLVHNSLYPEKVVLHIITDRKTYSPMQAWFSLHPSTPAITEVKGLHHFDWLTKGKVPVLEAMEKDQRVRSQFRGGSSAIVANNTEKPYVIASKLQALSPKYNSLMNHIRIYLPELFPSLNKVVFLDDDIVVQTDLSALWDIDMNGKVNGAVETCRGGDKFVMSKRLKSYLNFSHPLISQNFDPNECAWAYGMNIFDLEAWRKTDISKTYDYWLKQNLKSDLSLWQLGTLPPGLIAFHGHVKIIDPFWHMLGLGYQENTSIADAKSAGVVHFNGRAKPWLDIAFPELQKLWTKKGYAGLNINGRKKRVLQGIKVLMLHEGRDSARHQIYWTPLA